MTGKPHSTLQFLERIAIDLKFKEDQHHVDCRYFQANLQIIQINVAKCSELQAPDETAAAAATVRSENSHSITIAALYLLVESEIFVGSLTTII